MFAITGITGHVGGAAARYLLEAHAPVRAVVRRPGDAERWHAAGADPALADFTDPDALSAAFVGCHGAFVMLPTLPSGSDSDHRALVRSLAAAVAASGVPHVVVLSSFGADLVDGTGPIRWLHDLECRLIDTGTTVTAVRAPHFQEKVEAVLPVVLESGTYPVFGDPDAPAPMVATRDVGAVVAQELLATPERSEVIDLDADAYTERAVAGLLADVLDRALQVEAIPRGAWLSSYVSAGVPRPLADELVALHEADLRGVLAPRGDRQVRCATPIDTTLRAVVGLATSGGVP